MVVKLKFWFFRWYWFIALLVIAAILAGGFLLGKRASWEALITILVGVLSYTYFVQKQKLEELKLFRNLFIEFNHRYDNMNEKLNSILQKEPGRDLTQDEKNYLYDYFNLCGEEYFYYEQGYIFPKVWKAWINGMKIFYNDKRIRKIWEEDLETNSYYGFNLDLLI